LLSVHLLHGVDSMFQTFGLRNHRWATGLRRVVALYCLIYLVGNVVIPGAILTGWAKPAAGTTAATKIASAPVVAPAVVQR
jgi:succinate dehydrogenase / fumarate reductase cytochrome b subunit